MQLLKKRNKRTALISLILNKCNCAQRSGGNFAWKKMQKKLIKLIETYNTFLIPFGCSLW